VWELRGVSCIPLELAPKPKKGIIVARSFSRAVETMEELSETICHYIAKATEKLRRQGGAARFMSIFVHTNPHDPDAPQYANGASGTILFPSAFPPDFFVVARELLTSIYRPGYQYKRAGVFLSGIRPESVVQADLFAVFSIDEHGKKCRLMQVVDFLNERLGRDTVFFGAQGIRRDWQTKHLFRSKRFSTQWHELLKVT
jgi:DNA polymerase V